MFALFQPTRPHLPRLCAGVCHLCCKAYTQASRVLVIGSQQALTTNYTEGGTKMGWVVHIHIPQIMAKYISNPPWRTTPQKLGLNKALRETNGVGWPAVNKLTSDSTTSIIPTGLLRKFFINMIISWCHRLENKPSSYNSCFLFFGPSSPFLQPPFRSYSQMFHMLTFRGWLDVPLPMYPYGKSLYKPYVLSRYLWVITPKNP